MLRTERGVRNVTNPRRECIISGKYRRLYAALRFTIVTHFRTLKRRHLDVVLRVHAQNRPDCIRMRIRGNAYEHARSNFPAGAHVCYPASRV